MARKPSHRPSPLTEMVARILKVSRECPQARDDVLEIMLLVSQIQAQAGIDHGYRDARRVVARLRHPLWDLAPPERALLDGAASAIQRACRLKDDDIPPTPEQVEDSLPERARLRDGIDAALGAEFSPEQIAKITGAVTAVLQGRA